jgi:chromosome segregation ATPase
MDRLVTIIEELYNSAKTAEKEYSNEITDFQLRLLDTNNKLSQTVSHISHLENKYSQINKENEELKETVLRLRDEIANLKKVSIYTNLNKQIMEKDNYIAVLEKQMNIRQTRENKMNEKVVEVHDKKETVDDIEENEEEAVDDVEENEEEAEDIETDEENEDEIEYETVKIGKKYYYVSNEEPEIVYEVIKGTNEVGEKIGKYDRENNKIIK